MEGEEEEEEEEDADVEEHDVEEEDRSQDREAQFVRAFCAEIYREDAGCPGYHLDWTPGLNTYSVWPHGLGNILQQVINVKRHGCRSNMMSHPHAGQNRQFILDPIQYQIIW